MPSELANKLFCFVKMIVARSYAFQIRQAQTNSETDCRICMESCPDLFIFNCGHASFCETCIHGMTRNRITNCPVCRNPSTSFTNCRQFLPFSRRFFPDNEYRRNLPQIEDRIEFEKLDKWIEHPNIQRLDFSTHHPIFLEIKKIFEVILKIDRSVMDDWKYKNTFINVERSHYDTYEVKKVIFVQMDWIDSFVTSFIWHLYH
jgi:hypothetical protein